MWNEVVCLKTLGWCLRASQTHHLVLSFVSEYFFPSENLRQQSLHILESMGLHKMAISTALTLYVTRRIWKYVLKVLAIIFGTKQGLSQCQLLSVLLESPWWRAMISTRVGKFIHLFERLMKKRSEAWVLTDRWVFFSYPLNSLLNLAHNSLKVMSTVNIPHIPIRDLGHSKISKCVSGGRNQA